MRNLLTAAAAGLLASGCATTATIDPAALIGSEWRVTQIGSVAVPPNSRAAIGFGADGRFYGNAGCNRMFGTYRVDRLSCPLLSGPSTMTVWTKEGRRMPAKKHKPEEIIGKLREVEIMLGQGGTTAEACRRIAVSEQTYYRWRKEYGGLKTDQARRMKDLEKENLRLRRAISDLTLDKLILQEAAKGNF
jgi:transposase-like protein